MNEEKEEKVPSISENPAPFINEKRNKFYDSYRKQKTFSLVVMSIFIALMAVSIYLLISFSNYLTYILIGTIVVFLGTFLYTRFMRKSQENKIREYIFSYRKTINDYIYSESSIENMEQEALEKLNNEEILDLNLIENASSVDSNNLVKGELKGMNFQSGNVVIYKEKEENQKNAPIGFYGKLYLFETKETFENTIMVYLANEEGNGPDCIKKLDKIEGILPDEFKVYSLNKDIKKFLHPYASLLKEFERNEYLSDMLMILKGNKIAFFLSYNDLLIDIATKDEITPEMIEVQKKHWNAIEKIVEKLTK